MACSNEIYYSICGLAYVRGVDNFEALMPQPSVANLYRACLETRGINWVNSYFINRVITIAGRKARQNVKTF